MYLDADVLAGISAFAFAEQSNVEEGIARLGRDLTSGAWHTKHGHVLKIEDFDAGYRLLRVLQPVRWTGSRTAGAPPR